MDLYKYKYMLLVIYILLVKVKQGESSLVTDNCAITQRPDICVSTFNADPRSAQVANITELIRLGMLISVSMANETYEVVSNPKSSATDEQVRSNMDACEAAYKDIPQTVGVEGLQMLDNRNYSGASYRMVTLSDAAFACNETGATEVADMNTKLYSFSCGIVSIILPLERLDPNYDNGWPKA